MIKCDTCGHGKEDHKDLGCMGDVFREGRGPFPCGCWEFMESRSIEYCRTVERWDGGPIYCFHALPCSKHSILNQ